MNDVYENQNSSPLRPVADGVRFELTLGSHLLLVFKTGPFSHLGIHPYIKLIVSRRG